MACLLHDTINAHISGLVTDVHNTKDNAIWYKIQVEVKEVWWHVERRYSDFEALHRKLVDSQGIPKHNIRLPPKKLIGNKEPQFVEQRREQLDLYLKNIVQFLGRNPPDDLAQFLNFYDFEIIFMLKKLAVEIFEKGDQIIANSSSFTLSPFQIYAINERMRLALPPLDSVDKRHDFGHIADFCTRLKALEIVGSNIPLGKSTIIPNQYPVDLSPFKALQELTLKIVNVDKLVHMGTVRETIEQICLHNSHLESTNQLLLCDNLYKSYSETGSANVWPNILSLDLNNNTIKSVDDIGNLVPSLRRINLSFNQLCEVFSLTSLPYLEQVSYNGNVISFLTDLHVKFGNIKILDMSQNQIESLKAFRKLYSLVILNLSCNKVVSVEEIKYLSELPCLESLILTGNEVASSVDYRVRALSYFGARANDVYLDNEKASLTEMDQISILQAIELARKSTLQK